MTNKLPRYLLMAIYSLVLFSYVSACSQQMMMDEMMNEQQNQIDQMNQNMMNQMNQGF